MTYAKLPESKGHSLLSFSGDSGIRTECASKATQQHTIVYRQWIDPERGRCSGWTGYGGPGGRAVCVRECNRHLHQSCRPKTSPIPGAPGCPNTNWTETITDLRFTLALLEVEQPIGTEVFAACFALSGPSGATGHVTAAPVDLSQCAALEDNP